MRHRRTKTTRNPKDTSQPNIVKDTIGWWVGGSVDISLLGATQPAFVDFHIDQKHGKQPASPQALLSALQNLMLGKPSMSTPSTSFAVASILAILGAERRCGPRWFRFKSFNILEIPKTNTVFVVFNGKKQPVFLRPLNNKRRKQNGKHLCFNGQSEALLHGVASWASKGHQRPAGLGKVGQVICYHSNVYSLFQSFIFCVR